MKKKLFSAGLAAVLVLSVPGVTMAAAGSPTIGVKDGTAEHDVYATYVPIAEADTVYSVDIQWGSMEFTYNAATVTKTWDPMTHTYKEETAEEGSWSYDVAADANKISVTNKSNKALTATIAAKTESKGGFDYTGITAVVENETLSLADASIGAGTVAFGTTTLPTGTKTGTASTAETTITLEGKLENKNADKTPIGSITVTIADAEEVVAP